MQWLPDVPVLRPQVARWLGLQDNVRLPRVEPLGPDGVLLTRYDGGPEPTAWRRMELPAGCYSVTLEARMLPGSNDASLAVQFGTTREVVEINQAWRPIVVSAELPWHTDNAAVVLAGKGVGTTQVRRIEVQAMPQGTSIGRDRVHAPGATVVMWVEGRTLPLQALPPDTLYRILARWPDGRTYLSPEWKTASAPAAPPARDYIRSGTLVRNGRPWIPIGIYAHYSNDTSQARALGMNLVVTGWPGPPSTPGLDVIPLYNKPWRQETVARQVEQMVAQGQRGRPLAWYPIDEPDLNPARTPPVAEVYHALKRLDASRPVFQTVYNAKALEKFAPTTDILAPDPYVISTIPRPIWQVATTIDVAVRVAGPNRCVMVVEQAFGLYPYWIRPPTSEEARCMAWLALNHGARGIIFYAQEEILWHRTADFRWRLRDDPLWDGVRAIVAEVRSMEAAIVSNEPSPWRVSEVSDTDRWLDIGVYGSRAVVVNVTRQPVRAMLKIEGPVARQQEISLPPLGVSILTLE